jgi:hypothetical protein
MEEAVGIDESLIQEIVRCILTVAKPDKIILFGSAAATSILSLLNQTPGDRQQEYVRIRRALRGMNYPFDIILISTQWFEESNSVIGGIAYPASKCGKVIYEAA